MAKLFASLETDLFPWDLRYCGKPLEELSKEELIQACKIAYQMYEFERRNHQRTLNIFKPLEKE